MKEKDINSLEHTSWRCQYHIVFASKYRRLAIYRKIKVDIGKILRQLNQNVDIVTISKRLGHSNPTTTQKNICPSNKKQ